MIVVAVEIHRSSLAEVLEDALLEGFHIEFLYLVKRFDKEIVPVRSNVSVRVNREVCELDAHFLTGVLNSYLQCLLGSLFLGKIDSPVHSVHELYLRRLVAESGNDNGIAHTIAPEAAEVGDDELVYLSDFELVEGHALAEIVACFNRQELNKSGTRSEYAVEIVNAGGNRPKSLRSRNAGVDICNSAAGEVCFDEAVVYLKAVAAYTGQI